MKDIFDPKRFGRYFAYELNTARQNCGLTLLVTCAIPIIGVLAEMLITADIEFNGEDVAFRWFLAMVAVAITVISFPVKLYGNITDRRAGSWWALIPASAFEKFLSAVLMTCVVLPVCFVALYSVADALVCLIPGYGKPLFSQISALRADLFGLYYSAFGLFLDLWANWCASVLTFTLGAIFFRKGKVSKTILVIIALGFLLSSVLVWIINSVGYEHWENLWDTDFCSMDFPRGLRTLQIIVYTVANAILLAGNFFRLKTIKY